MNKKGSTSEDINVFNEKLLEAAIARAPEPAFARAPEPAFARANKA